MAHRADNQTEKEDRWTSQSPAPKTNLPMQEQVIITGAKQQETYH